MRNSFIYTLLIATCLMTLSGCGQKGPLFIPEDPQTQAAEAAQDLSEEEIQKKKQKAAE
jgi:predicted small lipoprotein YifL